MDRPLKAPRIAGREERPKGADGQGEGWDFGTGGLQEVQRLLCEAMRQLEGGSQIVVGEDLREEVVLGQDE